MRCDSYSIRSRAVPAHAGGVPFAPRGFSLTELMVVIGIIVLLVSILLVALGQVRKQTKGSQTETRIQQFVNACITFQTDHGYYPGVIPEDVLAFHANATNAPPPISGTENALLHLMGGWSLLRPTDPVGSTAETQYNNFTGTEIVFQSAAGNWRLKVNPQLMGQGSVIDGKPYPNYFTAGTTDLSVADGQVGEPATVRIPDLVDGFGQPIIYLRQARTRGQLFDDAANKPQFLIEPMQPYTSSTALAGLAQNQLSNSLINTSPDVYALMAKVVEHPGMDAQARGAIVLLSAGADGIYLSRTDGKGSNSAPVDDILNEPPSILDEYDDIRIFSGG